MAAPGLAEELLILGAWASSQAADILKVVGGGEGALARFVSARHRNRKRAALLYAEVLYNLALLTGAQRLRPPRLLASRRIWDAVIQNPDYLSGILAPLELAALAGAYMHLETVDRLLSDEPLTLLHPRLKGEDQVAIEGLTKVFREAELVLRRRAFDRGTQKRLAASTSLKALHEIPTKQPLLHRVQGGAASMPSSYLFIFAGSLYVAAVVGHIRESLRRVATASDGRR
jgi:hypothetical protein